MNNRTNRPGDLLIFRSAVLTADTVRSRLGETALTVEFVDSFEEIHSDRESREWKVVLLEKPATDKDTAEFRRLCGNIGNPEIIYFFPSSENKSHSNSMSLSSGGDLIFALSHLSHIRTTVELALKHHQMKEELYRLRGHVAMSYGFDNIVGQSEVVTKLRETLNNVSATDITILLYGPRGSGRSLVAHTLHHHSRRRHEVMQIFDPAETASEEHQRVLFGDSSTEHHQSGLITMADQGTFYLKNIDRLAPEAQNSLAEFLKTSRVSPTNETYPGKKQDIRLIASTDVDLETMVATAEFNRDLWHQINVLPIRIPSVKERTEDIELLIEYLLRRIAAGSGRPSFTLTPAAVEILRNYCWPGEVKELDTVLQRAAAVASGGIIDAVNLTDPVSTASTTVAEKMVGAEIFGAARGKLAEGQKKLIIKALDENNWNFTQTAQELGIGRTTLWRKVKKYRLKREESEIEA